MRNRLAPKFFRSLLVVALFAAHTACTSDEPKAEEIIEPVESIEEPALPEEDATDMAAAFDYQTATIYFDYDDDTVKADSMGSLQSLADHLMNSGEAVVIEGHCDERGSVEYNLALGERRAYSVMNYLTTLGVNSTQMSTISYGKEKLKVFGMSEEDHAQNRRVEFRLP